MFGRVFRESPVFRWVRGDTSRYDLAISMCDVRTGDRLLYVGGADMRLFAALAGRTGLSGSASALVANEEIASAARTAAEQVGTFVEVSTAAPGAPFPFDTNTLDLIIVDATAPLAEPVDYAEVRRRLRPGGRVVAVGGGVAGGFLPTPKATPGLAEELSAAMTRAFPAARVLAERDGWVFVEALKGEA